MTIILRSREEEGLERCWALMPLAFELGLGKLVTALPLL